MGLSDTELSALAFVNWICSILSVFGSLFVIVSYQLFADPRNKQLKWIYYLSVSNLFGSFSFVLSVFTSDELNGGSLHVDWICVAQGIGIQYFYVAGTFWMFFIAHAMLLTFQDKHYGRSYDICAHIVSWGVPLIFVVVILIVSSFGNAGIWCWIVDKDEIYRYAFFYAPTFFGFLGVVVIYFHVAWKIKNTDKESIEGTLFYENRARMSKKVSQRGKHIILFFILIWCVGIINRIYTSLTGDVVFWISILHSIGSSIGGFINSIIYGRNRILMEKYRIMWTRLGTLSWSSLLAWNISIPANSDNSQEYESNEDYTFITEEDYA